MEAAALDVNGLFEWNKNYYYEKAAEEAAKEWNGTTQAPEEKDMEGGIDWQKAEALSRSGLSPDQRAAQSKDDAARLAQLRQEISDAGFDADRILDNANRLRNQQKMQEETRSMTDFASGSTAGAIAATAASYGSNLLSSIGSVGILAQRIFGSGSGVTGYRPVDYNAPSTSFSQVTSATREAVSAQMGETGQFLYGTLNSAVDSAARMLVAKAIGTGFLPDGAGQAAVDRVNRIVSGAVSAQMSTQVFTDAFLAAKQSGATDDDAILDALVQASIEGITEKYSVDAILKNPNNLVLTALRNNFIAEQCRLHPEFIGFATLHPDYPNPEAEIERVMALGLKGIKLHPDMQRVNTDDPRLMRIYEAMEGRLPLMVHCGDSRPQLQFSHPRHLAAVLKAFPALVVDAAHLGGWGVWDIAAPLFEHENCFFDVSSCLAFLDGPQLCAIARRYGTERVMFGSDFPIWDPARELQAVLEAGFTDAELEGILGGNCRRYLGV